MSIYDRIAKKIVGRSQIIKECVCYGDSMCNLHIEESVYSQETDYCVSDFENDIDGFAYDVNRELASLGLFECNRNNIRVHGYDNGGLIMLSYDCKVQVGDETMEKIRGSEWKVKEI